MITYLRTAFKKLFKFITGLFLSGLFTILPIVLTLALFHITFKFLKTWLEPVRPLISGTIFDMIPHAEIIFAIVVIFFIGTILRFFILRTILHTFERIISHLPLIRPVYTGIKQLVEAFSVQDKISFKKVVLIEFPRKNLYSIGFLTSEMPHELIPEKKERFFNVFVPTTPNPTSGYFVILPEEDITIVDLTRQEAMALIISGGIIQPERFKK